MTFNRAYEAAATGAVLMDRSSEGRLRISGADRVPWLQGLITNDVAALRPGDGCYATYLTPQGRMISDLRVLAFADEFLIDVPTARRSAVVARLDEFIITEDVVVEDVTAELARLALHGPDAPRVLIRTLEELLSSLAVRVAGLEEHQHVDGEIGGQRVIIAGSSEIGWKGFDLYAPARTLAEVLTALSATGAVDVDGGTWDLLRIEAGRPAFGIDMDTETIPLEAGIESRAISLTKGCYVGQEVIIRVLHRGGGRVARRLVGLTLEGDEAGPDAAPAPGTALTHEGREIGRITSAAWSPSLSRSIALGYVHRDFVTPGTTVSVSTDPVALAHVTDLPFVRHSSAPR